MLLKTVLVILGQSTTQPVNDHKNYGRRQDTPYDDQQKFHAGTLASVPADATPAGLGRIRSAEMVPYRPNVRGISAYIPFMRAGAMLEVSHKEDASWMNLVKARTRPEKEAESVSSSLLLLWFYCCFMPSSQAGVLAPLAIQQRWMACNKAHPRSLWTAKPVGTTQRHSAKGGCSVASAFGVFATHSLKSLPQTEARTC
ncbi:hypothetical protein [Loktanella sp. 5RATIMAR09]|uniref:hypothetical protein n=1 Tax=Loktanella sp. 5RATIMAR09 TaxID=1225655 RepID=UPI0012ED5B10|nr:hypothetical protein [Loktanella sp. 5RATIMAR09]